MKTRIPSVLAIGFSAILLGIPVSTWSAIDSIDWVFVGAPLGDTSLRDMAVDPEDGNLWYVGSQANGLYVTRDGGNTWEQHIGGTVGAIAIDPDNHNTVYAGSGSDLSFAGPAVTDPDFDRCRGRRSIERACIDGNHPTGHRGQFEQPESGDARNHRDRRDPRDCHR